MSVCTDPVVAEIDTLLRKLACLLRENEKTLSFEECRICFNLLPDVEKSAFDNFVGILSGRRQRKSTKKKKVVSDNESRSHDDNCSLGSNTCLSDIEDIPSDDNSLHEEECSLSNNNPTEHEINSSGDTDDSSNQDTLSNTNFAISTVTIAPSLRHILKRCRRDPKVFFAELCQTFPTSGGWGAAFCKIRQGEGHADLLKIHRRFDLRNLYLQAVQCGYHTGKSWRWNARVSMAVEIKRQFPSLTASIDEIEKELGHYINLGRGYETWVTEFGHPAFLIALPLDVSETE